MPDPFDQLAAALAPAPPDPVFVARLRGRIERALDRPTGATMPEPIVDELLAPITAGAAITPYLAVAGASAAIVWYEEAFGAHLLYDPVVMPDGRIGHAELELAGATFMLSDESSHIGVAAPIPGEAVPVTVHLEVADVDVVVDRAVAAGARLERPAADYDYGRNAVVRDPFGHRWLVSAAPRGHGLRHGDIAYVSLWVDDPDRAALFFSAVLGWTYSPGSGARGRQVKGLNIHHGLWGTEDAGTLFCCFAVDDIVAATERARSAGGIAEEPHPEPYGLVATCTDDQGVGFALFEPPDAGLLRAASKATGVRPGDLAYVTMEVVDSGRARAFYGRVLGWHFSSGRVAGGWHVDAVMPMVGLSGGHEAATTIPLYVVDDIAFAVRAVRRAGGSATEPETQPYGITANCCDDQGTRFYLCQF
ncbi:MAG TPA: VOC family protein [Acidimicrobiales bacterium]|nr:VOC family protein [Acidimicrobiales bacterium]